MNSETYYSLCRENSYLYGNLEHLSIAIAHAVVSGDREMRELLIEMKVRIKRQIEANLDKIEAGWTETASKKR